MNAVDNATVQMLQHHWEEGWNRSDLERIMAPLDEDVVFSSPGVAMLTGDPPTTTISGRDALRAYIEDAPQRTSGVRYTLQATYVGTDSIVLTYACGVPDGLQKLGADSMRVGPDHTVVEWRCHY